MKEVDIMTKIQKAILDTVQSSEQHLTAVQIYTILLKQFPSISLGTVYRNLSQFADSKLIRRVTRTDSADYYEKNLAPHDHSICICCGNMTDIHIEGMKDFIKDKVEEDVLSFDILLTIICQKCKINKKLEDKL